MFTTILIFISGLGTIIGVKHKLLDIYFKALFIFGCFIVIISIVVMLSFLNKQIEEINKLKEK